MSTSTKEFNVTGMSCGHCENAIKTELVDIPGIEEVRVSAADGSLSVTLAEGSEIADTVIIDAVEEAGYTATSAK